MKKFYAIVLGFSAILLAVTAAYFSVFGLSKLFVGAALAIIIMAGTLEFVKIVIVSLLHQYWKKLARGLRTYLLLGVIVLMVITSTGIYGFLSSAYSKVSIDLEKMGGNIELLDKRIEIKKEEKLRFDEQIKTKNERINSLTNLRRSQESRLDSLYKKGWVAAAKKTEEIISKADEDISELNIDINETSIKIENLNDSIAKYETLKLEEGSGNIVGEVGPLKYISKLTGLEMDVVVNWLIFLLIIVFDPLAVALIVSTSSMIKMIREERNNEKINDKKELFKKKVKYISDEKGNFKLENENEESDHRTSTEKEYNFEKEDEFPVNENNVNEEKTTKELEVENIKEKEFANDEFEIEEKTVETNNSDVEEVTEKAFVSEEHEIEEKTVETNNSDVEETVVEKVEEKECINNLEKPFVEETEEFTKEEPLIQNNAEEKLIVEQQNTEEQEQEQQDQGINQITDGLRKQSIYLRLLQILYNNGNRKSGDKVPPYLELRKNIEEKMPNLTEKDTKDFLLVCNLFKITDFKDGIGYFEKDYPQAFTLVSKI